LLLVVGKKAFTLLFGIYLIFVIFKFSPHISRVSSGAAARKANAAVFIYAKRSLTKQMRRWECARRVNRRFRG